MSGAKEERVYRLTQTVVRRVREPGEANKKTPRASSAKSAKP
jgi:hypothetical protein